MYEVVLEGGKASRGSELGESHYYILKSARWYKHIESYSAEHETLPGDASKQYTAYGPSTSAGAEAPKAAAEDDDDDVDLFGSSDDEVDEEAEKVKQQRLAEYAAKKANKPKYVFSLFLSHIPSLIPQANLDIHLS